MWYWIETENGKTVREIRIDFMWILWGWLLMLLIGAALHIGIVPATFGWQICFGIAFLFSVVNGRFRLKFF